jgi:hypothetical protein
VQRGEPGGQRNPSTCGMRLDGSHLSCDRSIHGQCQESQVSTAPFRSRQVRIPYGSGFIEAFLPNTLTSNHQIRLD